MAVLVGVTLRPFLLGLPINIGVGWLVLAPVVYLLNRPVQRGSTIPARVFWPVVALPYGFFSLV